MPLYILQNPSPNTRASVFSEPTPGAVEMTEQEFATWLAAQPPLAQPEPVPASLTREQFFNAMALLDQDEDTITATIRAVMPDGPQRKVIISRIRNAATFNRADPDLIALAPVLGFSTPEQIDQFFKNATPST